MVVTVNNPCCRLTCRRFVLAAMAAFPVLRVAGAETLPGPITPAGRKLAAVLDGMDVEALWQRGYHIDWRTGVAEGPPVTMPGGHTHCSAFAAAVAARLGIYLLRPPDHPQMWLANAQERWLDGAPTGPETAQAAGWHRLGKLADPGASLQAVALANAGKLVLAVYFQPPRMTPNGPETRAGHVAIVRPSDKPPELIEQDGPDVIQTGSHNYSMAPMRLGFASHRAGWTRGEIEYFWHDTALG